MAWTHEIFSTLIARINCSNNPNDVAFQFIAFRLLLKRNEIKIKKEAIEINFLDSTKDKVFKKGVDFKDNIKKIYEGLNLDKKIVWKDFYMY